MLYFSSLTYKQHFLLRRQKKIIFFLFLMIFRKNKSSTDLLKLNNAVHNHFKNTEFRSKISLFSVSRPGSADSRHATATLRPISSQLNQNQNSHDSQTTSHSSHSRMPWAKPLTTNIFRSISRGRSSNSSSLTKKRSSSNVALSSAAGHHSQNAGTSTKPDQMAQMVSHDPAAGTSNGGLFAGIMQGRNNNNKNAANNNNSNNNNNRMTFGTYKQNHGTITAQGLQALQNYSSYSVK